MAASTIVETAAAAMANDKGKAEPTTTTVGMMITKETVPQSFIDRIKARPTRRMPPLSQEEIDFYNEFGEPDSDFVEYEMAHIIRWNCFVDLEQDCLRQYQEKGFAEVGVDLTDGVKKIFILPQD